MMVKTKTVGTRALPIRGHHPDRTSVTTPHAIAATRRVYELEDVAMTREALLAARGWDQRHRRYRRRAA